MRRLLAIAAIGVLAACGGAYTLSVNESKTAELGATKYALAEGGAFVSCSPQDSDGDGYVTCTTKAKDGSDKPLLCSYKGDAVGCKPK